VKVMYNWSSSAVLLLSIIALWAVSAAAAVHVDSLAVPGGDGSDWEHAYNRIMPAISKAGQTNDEVWVKAGTYGAEYGSAVIYLTGTANLYGGFAGTERTQADRDARDWKNNPTILNPQGQVCIQFNLAGNPYIDGFVLTGATFAAFNIYACSPTIVNCLFRDNITSSGAVYIVSTQSTSSNVIFKNCVFLNNRGQRASAVHHHSSLLYNYAPNVYINCTFAHNVATGQGAYGGATIAHTVSNWSGAIDYIYNTVMWDNTYTTATTIDGDYRLYSSYIEPLPIAPGFVDLANNNIHLTPDSPCIDAGTSTISYPAGLYLPLTDFEGDPRIVGSAPDIGADEYSVPDTDDDGVPDFEEMGPNGNNPNYDGNENGVPDSQEDSVASLHTYDHQFYVTLAVDSPSDAVLAEVAAVENPSPGDTPTEVNFLCGFFEFTINGIVEGGAASVALILPDGMEPATYFRHGPTAEDNDPHWYEFLYDDLNPPTGADINDNLITLWFLDGQRGDDILFSDAVIVDAGGPGFIEGVARAEIDPPEYDFGPVTVGEQTDPAPFIVCNMGDAPLEIDTVEVDNLENYYIDWEDCSDRVLLPEVEDCCSVEVIFSPATGEPGNGIRHDAQLVVESNDPASPIQGNLVGYGIVEEDADGDSVPDAEDNCPNTPNPGQEDDDGDNVGNVCDNCPDDPFKIETGFCGCGVPDMDSDGDGIADCNDNCASDPDKSEPGICGCGNSDNDSDGDGVPDCNDQCPVDSGKIEPGVCGCGVADVDSDNDGIADCMDNCPYDPANDADQDGVCGDVDNCPATPNPDQSDTDDNGIGDACETLQLSCDLDQDGNIDIMDVRGLLAYRNQPVTPDLMQCDFDDDGVITVLDARKLILECTWTRCAASAP